MKKIVKIEGMMCQMCVKHVKNALLPLDPRQERDGFRGAKYFLETADIRRFIPMHQWEKFAFTDDFLAQYPQFRSVTEKVTEAGQIFTF